MRPEYDFASMSGGVRGKYVERLGRESNIVVLEPEVAAEFSTGEFKQVNDQLGHAVGDAVLTEVANRLRHCTRATDTIARLGGDEFAILAEHMTDTDDTETLAGRIIHALATPIDLKGTSVTISASVGVAIRQPHHRQADDLLLDADHAMYVAKSAGTGRYSMVPHA